MDYINVTDLRSKSLKLRENLATGKDTYLVYRSKVIGIVTPAVTEKPIKKFNYARFLKSLEKLPPFDPPTYEERKKLKKEYMEKKYGEKL